MSKKSVCVELPVSRPLNGAFHVLGQLFFREFYTNSRSPSSSPSCSYCVVLTGLSYC